MDVIQSLCEIVGKQHVLLGEDARPYGQDFTNAYCASPLAVVRPNSTAQISDIVKLGNTTGTAIVPISGNTGVVGGTYAEGAILLSMQRMNQLIGLRPSARIAIVEAGCIIATLQDAAKAHELIFPLSFGACGSAMIGGALSTNAGGSNVLRYGNARALCLGLEAVLPSGEIMDLMSQLHKDNSGYDLKDLIIGAEGTLGIITKAVLKLFPQPTNYSTALLAVPALADALHLLNTLQQQTGGAVEAFEYMPASYFELYRAHFPDNRLPFQQNHATNILVEIAGSSDTEHNLEAALEQMFEQGQILDAVIAQNEAQRQDIWAMREAAAEVILSNPARVDADICFGLDQIDDGLQRLEQAVAALDPDARTTCVAHLGDGNIHFAVFPSPQSDMRPEQFSEAIEEVVGGLRGSFSAEHGIGLSKRGAMARHKDPVALAAMRQIKAALDPNNILNPGKVLP
ncbi:MAG: FAD-binding oxidoreductase [Rhodobacterales bacterium]|nr:MAG: FAD-binding oxidoreductase [Rhodobacterales bacterium]